MNKIGGRQFGKKHLMQLRIKEWCKRNPGKKVLLANVSGSQVLTYYAGSKCFIYSPVKEREYTVSIDEVCNDWFMNW